MIVCTFSMASLVVILAQTISIDDLDEFIQNIENSTIICR